MAGQSGPAFCPFALAADTSPRDARAALATGFRTWRPLTTKSSLDPSPQVIGNKWDTYLDLLQADYTEPRRAGRAGSARSYCWRRMLMCHVGTSSRTLLNYNTLERQD